MHTRRTLLLLAPAALGLAFWLALPPDDLRIYLLLGQSNMAGRGEIADGSTVSGVWMLDADDEWRMARHPLHFDKPVAGVGPGLAFAREMPGPVGLVPCAVGGSYIARWTPGGDLFREAVRRGRIAQRHGRICGILWHQGEADAKQEAPDYGKQLSEVIAGLRAEFGDVPFVAGELAGFLDPEKFPAAEQINQQLRSLGVPNYGCASSQDLNHKGDEIHFDADSADVLGRRYAGLMIHLAP